MTDDIQVRRSGKWSDATLVERQPSGRVIVRVDGKRRGFDPCDVREVRATRVPAVRAIDPDEEESPSVRSVGTVRAPIVSVPKEPKPFRSRDHLASVAAGGCCVPLCREPAVAHHMENDGGSKKCDDLLTAPLCNHHHIDWWHGKQHLPGMDRIGSLALMWEAVARTLAARLRDEFEAPIAELFDEATDTEESTSAALERAYTAGLESGQAGVARELRAALERLRPPIEGGKKESE